MKVTNRVRIIALLAVVALAIPAAAKPFSKNIALGQTAKFGKTEVEAGQYRLVVDGKKIWVKQGNKVVAEAEGEWVHRESKAQRTSVLIGANDEVLEIRFAGRDSVLVLNGD